MDIQSRIVDWATQAKAWVWISSSMLGSFIYASVYPILIGLDGAPNVAINMSADEVRAVYPDLDVGHYIDAARVFRDTSGFDSWHPSIFPPGLSVIWGTGFWLFGEDHFVLFNILISAALWAIAMGIFVWSTPGPKRWMAAMFIAGFWGFISFRDWGIGIGSLFSESKSLPLFLAAFAFYFRGASEQRLKWLLFGTLLLAMATYVRAYFETVGYFTLTFWAIAVLFLKFNAKTSKNSLQDQLPQIHSFDFNWKRAAFTALAPLCTFWLLLAPWKVRNLHDERIQAFKFAPGHFHMTFYNLWLTPELLHPGIIGGNSACIADPTKCADLHAHDLKSLSDYERFDLAVETLIRHPWAWFKHRLSVFPIFWIDLHEMTPVLKYWRQYLEGIVLIIAGIIAFGHTISRFWKTQHPIYFLWLSLMSGFLLQNMAVMTVAGLDYRHSYPIRLFFFFSLLWSFGLIHHVRSQDSNREISNQS